MPLATLEARRDSPVTALCFVPGGKRLLIASASPPIHLWDLSLVRRQLVELGLDWNAPSYQEEPSSTSTTVLPRIKSAVAAVKRFQLELAKLHEIDEKIRASPNDFENWKSRGQINRSLTCFEQAIADFTHALSLKADSKCFLWRGECLEALYRYDEALADYEKCAELDPADLDACYDMADIFLLRPPALRDVARGTLYAERAQRLEPGTVTTALAMAMAHYRADRIQDALNYLTLIHNRSPEGRVNPGCLFFEAMCHARLGESAKANESFDLGVKGLEDGQAYLPNRQYYNAFLNEAREVLHR
jgi:tetratricopeptide (TPR) repeat protein